MKLELTRKQFRRLLDMAYIGNWILNSTRGEDRFSDYDEVESLLFQRAKEAGMDALTDYWRGAAVPSQAFAEGGIHEAIIAMKTTSFLTFWPKIWPGGTWTMCPSTRPIIRSLPPVSRPISPSLSSTAPTTFWWTRKIRKRRAGFPQEPARFP